MKNDILIMNNYHRSFFGRQEKVLVDLFIWLTLTRFTSTALFNYDADNLLHIQRGINLKAKPEL